MFLGGIDEELKGEIDGGDENFKCCLTNYIIFCSEYVRASKQSLLDRIPIL